jgi:hypothetical protein
MRTGIVFAATGQKQPDRNRNQEGRFHIGNLAQTAKNPKVNYSFETVQYQHPHSMKNALRDSPPQFQRRNLIAEARWWLELRARVPQVHWQPGLRVQMPQARWWPELRMRMPLARWWPALPAACPFLPVFCNPSTVPHKPIQIPLLIITVSSYSVKLF